MAVTDEMIKRINELARKAKESGLSEAEKVEQQRLRQEYIQAFRSNLESSLETIVIVDESGKKSKVGKKKKHEFLS